MKQIRKRLTYANVMSSIAVFLVLGGGAAFAATQLPKNSVGSPQIKKNAVKTGDIARNAVRVGKLAPEAAKAGKIAKNAIPTNRLRDGAVAEAKIGSGAVTGSKLGDGAVTGSKIAAAAVSREKLAEGGLLPKAYAAVNPNGTVVPALTIGIPDGTNPASGVYCFTLSFTPKSALVTVEDDTEPNDLGSVLVPGSGQSFTGCPGGTNLKVQTWDTQTDENQSEDFYVVVW